MRPLNVLKLQEDYTMDFVADCVLDMLSDYKGIVQMQTMVSDCLKNNVSSPATTYKKIAILKGLGLVEAPDKVEDPDKRKTFIKITNKGMEYLRKWER